MDFYVAFYKAYLQEMPQKVLSGNNFESQLEILRENLRNDNNVETIGANVHKLRMRDLITYWVGSKDASIVSLIVDVEVFLKYCKVVYPSKNPTIPKGSPPYASDLYVLIAKDVAIGNLIFTSDSVISDDAERLWKRLVSTGSKVSVYNKELPQYNLFRVNSEEELEKYIGGFDKRKYLFVLSENETTQLGVIHSFNLMEMKRLANWPLFEHLQNKGDK